AYSVPENICQFLNASATIPVITANDLNGTLPLCFTASTDANLVLKAGGTLFANSATITADGITGNKIFTGNATYTVNFIKNFIASDFPIEDNETKFFLKDINNSNSNPVSASYLLTLRPATITLTANVSTINGGVANPNRTDIGDRSSVVDK
ncbi:MAG: hypothetical protein ORN58_05360, partial [Sediminibacterium sp.]|nr:hypothetical protein [Sediminibacterium sp.]